MSKDKQEGENPQEEQEQSNPGYYTPQIGPFTGSEEEQVEEQMDEFGRRSFTRRGGGGRG